MAAVLRYKLARDTLIRASSPRVRLALVQNTVSVEEARKRWGVSDPRVMRMLGRTLTSASLLASSLSNEERVSLRFTCGASSFPLKHISVRLYM